MADAVELKARLRALDSQRRQMEQEIALRSARLESGGVGMAGPLVDGEGYPRADIDILQVRADRQQVRVLTNDHKALSSQIEQLLHQLHALPNTPGSEGGGSGSGKAAAAAAGAAPAAAAPAGTDAGAAARVPPPFAVVDEVAADSPASSAGIQLGDQLCSFAGVSAAPGAPPAAALQAVAAALAAHEGQQVEAVVLRQGAPVTLRLTPRQWGGRGLLGCHLRPM